MKKFDLYLVTFASQSVHPSAEYFTSQLFYPMDSDFNPGVLESIEGFIEGVCSHVGKVLKVEKCNINPFNIQTLQNGQVSIYGGAEIKMGNQTWRIEGK